MNTTEYLICCIAEECAEIIELSEPSGKPMLKEEAFPVDDELKNLLAVAEMLESAALFRPLGSAAVITFNDVRSVIVAASRAQVRASKAMRFGTDEVQPGQGLTNIRRLEDSLVELLSLARWRESCGVFDREAVERKKAKVRGFMTYSESCGALTDHAGRSIASDVSHPG